MPLKSQKQRAYLHAAAARGDVAQSVVDKFEAETPKGKKLPLRAPKRPKKRGAK